MGKLVKNKHLNLYKKYTEQLIEDLADPVTLVFDDSVVKCTNCVYDIVHKSSSGKYNGTGPKPFERGICPVCAGKGTTSQERRMTINCTTNWVNLTESDEDVALPAGRTIVGYYKIKTLVSQYNNIRSAKYIIIDDTRTRLINMIKRGLKENVTCVAYCIRDE